MFGLFKEKLSDKNVKHRDIINYLISEESVQQWTYHVIENKFEKEKFRGLPFAKQTLHLFVKNYLKMKVDDEVLSMIADLGYRRCREYLEEFFALEKKIKKININEIKKKGGIYMFFTNKLTSGLYPEMKFEHERYMAEGMGHIDFLQRNKTYNIVMQIQREMQCYMRVSLENKEFAKMTIDEQDKFLLDEESKILNLSENKQKLIIKKLEDDAKKIISKRNKFNELESW